MVVLFLVFQGLALLFSMDPDMELREEAWSPGPLDSEDQQMASHENPGEAALGSSSQLVPRPSLDPRFLCLPFPSRGSGLTILRGLSQAASWACVGSPSSLPAGSPWGLPPPLAGCSAPFPGGPSVPPGGMLFRPGWQAHVPVGQDVESWGQTVKCGERQARRAGPVTILGGSWVSGFLWDLSFLH